MRGLGAVGLLRPAMTLVLFRRALGRDGRREAWRALGATIGDEVMLAARFAILRDPANVTIGEGTNVGDVVLDAWGPITIGRNVILNGDIRILTGSHDPASPWFDGVIKSVSIGDHAWLPLRVLVLPGVTIGRCAVIGTGAVVVHDVPDYAIAVGNPARQVGSRPVQEYLYRPGRPGMGRP